MIRVPPMGPSRLLVLGLALYCMSGCLTQPTEDPTPDVPAAADARHHPDRSGSLSFFRRHLGLRRGRSGSSTHALACNPSIAADPEDLADLPGVIALA